MSEEHAAVLFGGARIGSVHIGVVGDGATVTIGAMGEGARAYFGRADDLGPGGGRHRRGEADPAPGRGR